MGSLSYLVQSLQCGGKVFFQFFNGDSIVSHGKRKRDWFLRIGGKAYIGCFFLQMHGENLVKSRWASSCGRGFDENAKALLRSGAIAQ